MNKNYLELNEVGIIDGIRVQCLPIDETERDKWNDNEGCCGYYNCAFRQNIVCAYPCCLPRERADRRQVYFKKMELI